MLFDEQKIVAAIETAEKQSSGEIRVHITGRIFGDIYKKGRKIFKKLGMTKTQERNGILFLIAEKSHKFAILGDAGIHERVHQEFWDELSQVLAAYFRQGQYNEGLCATIHACGEKLARYFPLRQGDTDELPSLVSRD